MKPFSKKKLLLTSLVANVFEWYDFSIYAYVAGVLGTLFFDENNPKLALIKSFALFSISYLIRPLGSFVFGYLADHYGRRMVLKTSFFLMAVPTFMIGLLPTFQSIGWLSIMLLFALRLVQSFATGGELPVVTCYVFEMAPLEKKNFYCSLVAASAILGVFLGSLVVTLLYLFLSQEAILAWGWRIPFLIGFIIAGFIFVIRKEIPETDVFQAAQEPGSYLDRLSQHKYPILQVFLLISFMSVSFYTLFVWMPSYLSVYLNIKPSMAHLTSSIALLSLVFFILVVGHVSHSDNRKKWITCSIFMMIVLSYPLFGLLRIKYIAILFIVQVIFALLLSFIQGVVYATIGSLFHPQIRSSGIGIGYTLAQAIFGGLTPTLSSWLIYRTGYVESPIFLVITMGLIAVPAVASLYRHPEIFST